MTDIPNGKIDKSNQERLLAKNQLISKWALKKDLNESILEFTNAYEF